MSYWRKLFVIVLLILSLPVQAFAAVSLKCESSHIRSEVAPMQHAEMDAPAHDHHMHELTMADGGDHDDHGHQHRGAHHAHSCGTCASCCLGVGLLALPAVAAPAGIAHFAVPLPPSVHVASFLTSGIERPPRISLV
ncbi:hypothetical protein [Paraburkholderia terricola]|uniref:hypothetical protein n=1 Tax=Paraburkholderia terricola TaxID=169427 RepID=UPI000DEFC2AC|nr:hypothetical protein [Paraburkholderia terricola]AXE92064.1 hypothetical protein CUJ90_06620 [Paraburkholderia terricola]